MDLVDCVVVGGGAAGLLAAAAAATRGERVALLEANRQVGRKILVSGNGRCNLTNRDADAARHYHGGDPAFVRPALSLFPVQASLAFFRDLGIETHEEKRGRLFPRSDQAQSIVEALLDRLQQSRVDLCTEAKVVSLTGPAPFVATAADGRGWQAERVVVASGGSSVAKLGADRSGLDLAVALGHRATPLLPGLVPLESDDEYVHAMQGVKVVAAVQAAIPGRGLVMDTDDLLFTAYGVSGFTVLSLSALVVPLLARGPVTLRVNLLPGQSAEQASELLQERWRRNPHRTLANSFCGLFSNRLVPPFLERFGFPLECRVDSVPKTERWRLAQALTDWPIEVIRPRSFEHAEVTIGGIRTGEVDAHTLESRLVPGLYFAGEVLDVHGDLGGFNFQWAWSSGWLAGQGRAA